MSTHRPSNRYRFVRAALLSAALSLPGGFAVAESHGIAMYGDPALPADFESFSYANADAPKGGTIVTGEVGSFDSLNPHILKGTTPWQLRFLAYESLMKRNYDEPFTLYGLLAESIETAEDRSWVEFTLHPDAAFSDGSPVTVEDVIWSYETLGTEGHPRYRGLWEKIETIEEVGDRTLRITFNTPDRELALLVGLRPILKKAQWEGVDFAESGLDQIPISSAPYVIEDFEAGRFVSLRRNADYWGADLPAMAGQANLDEIRLEFFGDGTVMFEAFKAGEINTFRENNAAKWATQFNFPAVERGEVVLEEVPHQRPSGMTGLAMNTRRPIFEDWRVRQAMIEAFNFEFINETLNGGEIPRITSYFSNSPLGMAEGPAEGQVAALLEPFADELLPGAIDGYLLPVAADQRNRSGLRAATALLQEAGWTAGDDGILRNEAGEPFEFEILLRQGATEYQQITDIYVETLRRLGIEPTIAVVDSAQYTERVDNFDFDMVDFRRGLSLSPGNEQYLYWGMDAAETPGSRNIVGVQSPAAEAMIDAILTAESRDDFLAATAALDRVLTSGRYVIPIWQWNVSWLAYYDELHHPDYIPIYGDWIGWQPDVWWYEEN